MIDDRTPLGLKKPHPDNNAREVDVGRIRDAFDLIDQLLAGTVQLVGGKVPESVLPALAITDTFVVATQAAMLALTAQRGDIAVRTDLSKCFALAAEPATTLAHWIELRTPADAVLSVASLTGAISAADLKTALAIASDIATALAAAQLNEQQIALAIAYSGAR